MGVVRRNPHPGDQEMGTPGAYSLASGFSPEKKPPRRQPPGLEPRACPGNGAGTSASLLLRAWVPRAGLALAPATMSQTLQSMKVGLCWVLGTLPLGTPQSLQPSVKDPAVELTRRGGNGCQGAMWSCEACGQGQHPRPTPRALANRCQASGL